MTFAVEVRFFGDVKNKKNSARCMQTTAVASKRHRKLHLRQEPNGIEENQIQTLALTNRYGHEPRHKNNMHGAIARPLMQPG